MSDYWEVTSEMYNGLIQKPKMTQKLLTKPPFRYIFDIFFQTSKKTNFAQGLFTGNQLSGDYYNDKDKKIQFLEKLIKLIQTMQGSQVKAKPQKIVAGLQPQATNAMLQSMFKLATGGQASGPFVAKVLGTAPAEQPPKKQEHNKKPEPKQEKKKIQRPPSARNQKKNQEQPPSKKQLQTHQQPPVQEPQVIKPQKKPAGKQEYSQKVKQMMNEGQQQVKAQKIAQNQDRQAKKDINMGRLRKKQNQVKEKVTNTGELSDKQLDLVKTMVQSICQNIGPLGKSIQFVNDDIQSMNKQLVYWRKQYNASKSKYQNELKMSEQALMPIYDKLAQIQDQIKDQKGKIQAAKSQIIKNDSTIKDLLMSVVTTK